MGGDFFSYMCVDGDFCKGIDIILKKRQEVIILDIQEFQVTSKKA